MSVSSSVAKLTPPNEMSRKQQEFSQRKDMQDWARQCGLAIKFPPSVFPVNSVKAMRGCLWLEPQGLLVPFAGAVFEAYWSREQDISDDAVLAGICARCGIEPAAVLDGIHLLLGTLVAGAIISAWP